MMIDTEYFSQRIQCSRNDKQECLKVIYLLAEIATVARQEGIKELDSLISRNSSKYSMTFLNKAVQLYMDAKDAQQIRTVLYNCIIASNFSGPHFLNAVIITETMAALHEQEDINYIFSYLIPSFYGMDFEGEAYQAYQNYRQFRIQRDKEVRGEIDAASDNQ